MPGVRGRRYLVLLAVVAGLLGLYAAAGFLLVPRWTRSQLVGLTARDFGRPLSLRSVRFNPFTWTLELTGFSLPDADGRPMVTFQRLRVGVAFSSVLHLAPRLRYITLDGPHVHAVVRHDGHLNLADLEKPFLHPAGAAPPAPSARPVALRVGRLTVAAGSASYEDDSRSTPFRLDLDPIAFQLLSFSTTGAEAGHYRLTATIGQGGRLQWTGTIRAEPISLRGALQLQGLSARLVGRYLGPALPAEISRGAITLQGSFAIEGPPPTAPNGASRMTIDLPRAQVTGLGVRPRAAASDYVQLGRFTLANAHIDLRQHSIRVGDIVLAGGDVRGWLDRRGRLNLLQLLASSAGPSATAGTPPPPGGVSRAPAWHISAPRIRIEDTRLSLQDRGVKPAAELTLGPLSGRISGYDSSAHSRLSVALKSAVNGKGQLDLSAAGTLQPQALHAKLTLHGVDLRPLQPYLNEYTALTLASGLLDTTLDIDRAGGRLEATGRIDVADLRAVDDDLKRDFVRWRGLHIVGMRYVSSPASLRIRRIVAVAPYARVIIGPDGTLNVSEALHPRGARTGTPAQTPARAKATSGDGSQPTARPLLASMPTTIGLVRIANGTADYADLSIEPRFATGIEDLHGVIKGLSSVSGSRARVDLKGKVNRSAPVAIDGSVNLLSAATYADIRMKFSGLELTRMTPYAVRFAGYRIASGTLNADLHYEVDRGRLKANHRLVIDQLQLGEQVASPHAVKLPLRLAVALLKDRDGVIRIGLPVTGSLNDPQFSLGPLIGKALLHVLEKAVTAPFAMLGRLFGGGADLNRVEFAPGSAVLPPAARQRAVALAKALAQRPQLRLQVPAVFAPEADGPALAERRLRGELLALARSGAGYSGKEAAARHGAATSPRGPEALELPMVHYRLLLAEYRKVLGPKAPLPAVGRKVPPFEPAIEALQSALLQRLRTSDAQLRSLGARRAQALRAAILAGGGVDPGRIEILPATARPAAAGKVVVQLGLK